MAYHGRRGGWQLGLQRNHGMDKLIAEMQQSGSGVAVSPYGEIYDEALPEGQNFDYFMYRSQDPIAAVSPSYLRAYQDARAGEYDQLDYKNNPSDPLYFQYTEKGKQERKNAILEINDRLIAAKQQFKEWWTPSKMAQWQGVLTGALPRDEIKAIQDILTFREWYGKQKQKFFLQSISQAVLTNSHHIKVADTVPNDMWMEDIDRAQVPRDYELAPRMFQLDVLRNACMMHVNYTTQKETVFDIEARQTEDAMIDYDRMIEIKHTRALEKIDVATGNLGSLLELSGQNQDGYHSKTKGIAEVRSAITDFEFRNRVEIAFAVAHPDTWEAYQLNTWSRIVAPNPHPAGLKTHGGSGTMVGLDGIQSISSPFVRKDRIYFLARKYGVLYGHGGMSTHRWMAYERMSRYMAINAFVGIRCTAEQVPWYDKDGEKGRGYGFYIPIPTL